MKLPPWNLARPMCLQMDIIPVSAHCYASPNCEDGIVIADEALREELKRRSGLFRPFMLNWDKALVVMGR